MTFNIKDAYEDANSIESCFNDFLEELIWESITKIVNPFSNNERQVWDPIKPAPPVNKIDFKTRLLDLFIYLFINFTISGPIKINFKKKF